MDEQKLDDFPEESLTKAKQEHKVGDAMPDSLRPEGFLPKPPPCKFCLCGYIIPEPTEEELKIKAQQAKIEEQSIAINTLSDSVKTLTEHLTKLTNMFNENTKK